MPASVITFEVEENLHFVLGKKTTVKNWLKKIVQQEGKTTGNISYFFCTDEYLLKLNRQFLNHDTYTDIITFDYSSADTEPARTDIHSGVQSRSKDKTSRSKKKIEGEIFISVERVKENAITFKQPFDKELMRTIVHGVLHLCGYKDKTPADKKAMRAKEDAALLTMNYKFEGSIMPFLS